MADKAKRFKELIIREEYDYLAINKPAGLASQGGVNIKESVDCMFEAYL